MFIDETVIRVNAGDGGNGCHSYERLKYHPRGKPDGGDGGRGGSIYVLGSRNIHTLQDSAYRQHYDAQRGDHGKGKNKTGKSGEDIIIPVPLGTLVYDADTNQILLDCLRDGQQELIAKGGRGGRGNASLVSPRNPNPESSEPGKPGEQKRLRFVLKVLADVGLVGRPNAGKSTFLSRISQARPKIADYPFTTTEPNLGIVRTANGHDSFVVADIPGLIENSHTGKGLGIRFLRHIERTRVLAIMVEASAESPEEVASMLLHELAEYSQSLAEKPKCFILTKNDLFGPDEEVKIPDGWMSMSAVTGSGVDEVLKRFRAMLDEAESDQDFASELE